VDHYKYLGVLIDSQLRWNEQAQRATANATKWTLQFRRLTKITTGVGPKLMRQLYLAVALPKITYGLDVWYTPPTKPAGYTKNIGSVGILRNLQKVQRMATTAITGTLRSAPTDLIDAHAGILPMELALLKACHRAIVRILTLPESHPLHHTIKQAKRHPPLRHHSPLDQLLKTFSLVNKRVEIIDSATHRPISDKSFDTIIDINREVSITAERADNADYKIYSDGSGHDDGIGAAAVLFKKDRAQPIKSLKKFLGPKTKHNTYEAEATGALLATWILRNYPEVIGKRVTLYIDNQALIQALAGSKPSSGQYIRDAIVKLANTLPCKLTIRWISSHSEVKGNEAADKLAKDAASGRSSRSAELPLLLRDPLPTSASALKQEYNTELNRKWLTIWDDSPRKNRFSQIDPEFPFNKFRKRLFNLTRKQTSMIMQLRTGHFPLNYYLHRINKVDSDRCTNCQEDDGLATETINHFLFVCPAHDEARDDLIDKIGREHFNLIAIMKDANNMKSLVTYINRTGRLNT
jgi:ribonuclease HI